MLQQTQVKTVLPFWERWMHIFPNAEALAKANYAEVLKAWEGLGYYTRARNLQAAAKVMVQEFGGRLPRTFAKLIALPGVGRYTAGAVRSIAFNQPAPAVDGNVIRVLTRVFGIDKNPRERSIDRQLWFLAGILVEQASKLPSSGRNCAHLNQALMELGALVCLPHAPQCIVCPVAQLCLAYHQGRTHEIPNLQKRLPTTRRLFFGFVVEAHSRFLVRQRPNGVVNSQLWEFPNLEIITTHADPARWAQDIFKTRVLSIKRFAVIPHSITRYRISLELYWTKLENPPQEFGPSYRWCRPSDLKKLPFASAHRKIAERLAVYGKQK